MRFEHHRRAVHPLDQHTRAVKITKIGRATQCRDVTGAQPVPHGIQQPFGDGVIFDDLEEPKATFPLAQVLRTVVVYEGSNGTDHLSTTPGQEERHVGMLIEGTAGRVQVCEPVGDQWGTQLWSCRYTRQGNVTKARRSCLVVTG